MNLNDKKNIAGWRFESPETEGLHKVIVPGEADCTTLSMYRLNLCAGNRYDLETGDLEMNAAVISGALTVACGSVQGVLEKLDSVYAPGNSTLSFEAREDSVLYIGCAPCDGIGTPFLTKFDPSLPLGDIHQIHGSGAGEREVMFAVSPQMQASRLITGYTWSGDGMWTGWPPHQHEKDLEEAYCYFDISARKHGFHISYLESGDMGEAVFSPVKSGTMMLAPRGYHPTLALPGMRNVYFWVLASFSNAQRRYDLAVSDPTFVNP